jgi:circadian clock protein KaiC
MEGTGRDIAASSALTTADTIVGLEYGVVGGRHVRYLDVIKQRGAAPYAGLHTYTISDDGITVFPRLEALPLPPPPAFVLQRAPFGLPELDALLHGGLTACTATILAGAPGVGKTTLALFWALHEATPDQSTLFVSFGEHPDQLRYKASSFKLDLEAYVASGALRLLRLSPIDIVPDIVANALLQALTPTTSRLVIDDVAALLYVLGDRGGAFLSALTAQMYSRGITTMFLLEIEATVGLRLNLMQSPLSVVSENIILMQHVVATGRLHRMLAVLKMRYSDFDQTLREVVLDGDGVRVLTPRQTGTDVLDEAAVKGGGFSPADV